jgi:hypothetical protein
VSNSRVADRRRARACGATGRREGVIWLGCSSRHQPRSRLRRLLPLDVGHTQRAILDLSELEAAA